MLTREIGGEETISASEADSVRKDGTRNGVTRTETSTGLRCLGFLGLEANIELKPVNISVQRSSGIVNRGIGIPFLEVLVRCNSLS